MLPTFVIGLREGLESALIVGIVASFLVQRDRRRDLKLVWIGVVVAVLICLAIGAALQVTANQLDQVQQERLETVVGAIAVAMVTYMVLWMRRHSRDLKGQLEGAAASALATGSALALVGMAFLAVIREGTETSVFLLAIFEQHGFEASSIAGVALGIAMAVAVGYGIYKGGVKINLSRFFRATGVVLVLVAAGLVMTTLHTAHEARWLDAGQARAFDLAWLVRPGSVLESLLTGVLGLQARPAVAEVIGWLVYCVPLMAYVLWPARKSPAKPATAPAEPEPAPAPVPAASRS